MNAGRMII
ncbi:hypothetical protein CP082626L3_0606A, partial [Chlamydia psittaci 08-2626_L3]